MNGHIIASLWRCEWNPYPPFESWAMIENGLISFHHFTPLNPPAMVLTLKKTKNCYFIHNNDYIYFSIFIVLLFIYEMFGSKSTESLSAYQIFHNFPSSSKFFVFALARKWNIFCTAVDSTYAIIYMILTTVKPPLLHSKCSLI